MKFRGGRRWLDTSLAAHCQNHKGNANDAAKYRSDLYGSQMCVVGGGDGRPTNTAPCRIIVLPIATFVNRIKPWSNKSLLTL